MAEVTPRADNPLTIDLPEMPADRERRGIGVEQPARPHDLHRLIASTESRIAVGRAGPRPRTSALLRFQADHAGTQDALWREVDPALIEAWGLFSVRSEVTGGRRQYLLRPDLGRKIDATGQRLLRERCIPAPALQIVVGDGLSAAAVETQAGELLAALVAAAAGADLETGTPFFVRGARVGVINAVGDLLRPEVVVLLIGERPGLGRADALSAYLAYHPGTGQTDADRDVLSGICAGGVPVHRAAGAIINLARTMIAHQAAGVRLKLALAAGR